MPTQDDFVKKLVIYGGIAVLAAAVGGLLTVAFGGDEEERPPIIVQGGSVEINVAWADDTNQMKGSWKLETGAKYSHQHKLTGPKKVRNIILNGACSGGAWRTGGLKILLKDIDNGDHTVEIDLNKPAKQIEIDPKGQTVAPDASDASHLTIRAANGKATRITRIESLGDSTSGCDFVETDKPVLVMVQTKK
jgi:hypothetical protein